MDEHKKFLADRLLSEERPITYRLLSRALDVHVNTAKEMLYDFYKYQNAQQANSVHATYLVYGTKAPVAPQENGDVEMTSSMPEHEPSSDSVLSTTLAIVPEEALKDTLATYQEVTSLHIYSLAPQAEIDLTLLADISRPVAGYANKDDASGDARKWGTILNHNARRRSRPQGAKTPPAPSPPKPAVKKEQAPPQPAAKAPEKAPAKRPAQAPQASKIKAEAEGGSSKDTTPASSAGKAAAPSLKRGGSGGIMQSFAKAAARPSKPKAAPAKKEDEAMALSDDGEADDSDMPQAKKKEPQETDATRKSIKEREEELRRMMEEAEDEDDAGDSDEKEEEEPADEEMEEAPEPEPEQGVKKESKEEEQPTEVVSSNGDGRKRGKRRVMQKKRILDDQGYMVTIQEQGWESFSEDDTAPPAKKPATSTPASSAPSASKAKKPADKPGQGNIMSFFSKK